MKKRVLLIENDEITARNMINRQLRHFIVIWYKTEDAGIRYLLDKNKVDIVLVDYFSNKDSCEITEACTVKQETYKKIKKELEEFQKKKEKIRVLAESLWDIKGGDIARSIIDVFEEEAYDNPPVAIYSRHAKSLVLTGELINLFDKGIYLAWKPKSFPGDHVSKREEAKNKYWEKEIVNRIIETHKNRQRYKKLYSKLEGTYVNYIKISKKDEIQKMAISLCVLLSLIVLFYYYYSNKGATSIGVMDSILSSAITGVILIVLNPIIRKFTRKD